MAQLKDTNVNGTLSVSGNIACSKSPTESTHVTNKEYVDGIGTVYTKFFYPIANNSTGANTWNTFTTDSYDITLPKGNYLITYTINCTSGGTGMLTAQMSNGAVELLENRASRVTAPCISGIRYTALNCSFVLQVTKSTAYSFIPRVWGNVAWTGQDCTMTIIKLTA